MNSPQCPQCGRAVSAVDRAGGSCPWCGRVLTVALGHPRRATRSVRRQAAAQRDHSGSSAWTFWWIPLVALFALRGVGTCNRAADTPRPSPPSSSLNLPPEIFEIRDGAVVVEDAAPDDAASSKPRITITNELVEEILLRRREELERNAGQVVDSAASGDDTVSDDPRTAPPLPPQPAVEE